MQMGIPSPYKEPAQDAATSHSPLEESQHSHNAKDLTPALGILRWVAKKYKKLNKCLSMLKVGTIMNIFLF
jgi:hypothetical protein